MSHDTSPTPGPASAGLSRRTALTAGSFAVGLAPLAGSGLLDEGADAAGPADARVHGHRLPVRKIERIIGADGSVSDGVLTIEVDRNDVTVHNSAGYLIRPSFQVNGAVVLQPLPDGRAMLNADLPFLAQELQPALDQMLHHGPVFQAMHQHFYDWDPMIWFMHFRGAGTPTALARGVKDILGVTSIPLPQSEPSDPTSPLHMRRLTAILGGSATVGADGVVTVDIPRREGLRLGGHRINPYLNVATTVGFEPLETSTAVVVDFGMRAEEVQHVTRVMRSQGWQVGCLYNQETDEQPQLYWAHMFKAGDPYELAREVHHGLRRMNLSFSG